MYNTKLFLQNLQEAEKTLEYTLLLPRINAVDINGPKSELIDAALFETYKNCHCKLSKKFNYNFFGRFNSTESIGTLFQSTSFNSDKNISEIYKNDFFGSSILSQCIMAAYDTCIQLLTTEQYITTYAITKLKDCGFNQCIEEGRLKPPFHIERQTDHSSASSSTKASSLQTKLDNRIRTFKHNKFDTTGLVDKDHHINFNMSALLYKITDMPASDFKHFLSLYNAGFAAKNSYKKHEYIRNFCDYMDYNFIFEKEFEKLSNAKRTDFLYYYYKLENIFNISLANCTAQFLNRLEQKGLYPNGKNELENIALISTFPNIFSRNLYLQYALESIYDLSNIYNNNFSILSQPNIGMYYAEDHPYNIYKWNITLKRFYNFFTKFIIPADEWHFIITLIKKLAPEENTLDSRLLQIMQSLLSDYISKNAERILYPAKSMLEANQRCYIEPIENINKYNEDTPFSFVTLLPYYKNETLIADTPIPFFGKGTLLKHTIADTNYNNILFGYISSVTTELL